MLHAHIHVCNAYVQNIYLCVHICVCETHCMYTHICDIYLKVSFINKVFVAGYSAAISETQNDSGMHIIEAHFSLVKSRSRWCRPDIAAPLSPGPHISSLFLLWQS